jgi:myo-inositol-1-phosphate synthase
MEKEIKVAFIGVGNCCSSLNQGLIYYKDSEGNDFVPGLMHTEIGGYKLRDIKPVCAFDVDKRKVGKDLSEAIFEKPNCTTVYQKEMPNLNAPVLMGNLLDGVSDHMLEYPEDVSFRPITDRESVDVVKELKDRNVDVLVNYLPVGSQKAAEFYANCALEAGCAFVNAMPIFIASDPAWVKKFEEKGLPCLGDDIKSQYGATFSHRQIVQGFIDRGVKINFTSQENYGGNTDFLNMSDQVRIQSKLRSKTSSIKTLIPYEIPELYAGPGVGGDSKHGYRPEQKDNKTAVIKVYGTGFGDIPVKATLHVDCEDSPNSGGIIIDAIRCAKLALDRNISGAITSPSSFFFKHPLEKVPDAEAKVRAEKYIKGELER